MKSLFAEAIVIEIRQKRAMNDAAKEVRCILRPKVGTEMTWRGLKVRSLFEEREAYPCF